MAQAPPLDPPLYSLGWVLRYTISLVVKLNEDLNFLLCCAIIARNRGHFAPMINCQRNLVFKMADKNYRSQGKRIPCDFLNNLSSVDLFYEEKSWN